MTPFDHLKNLHTKKRKWNDFNDEERINKHQKIVYLILGPLQHSKSF